MKWFRTGSFAAIDQAWLSLINFGVSIAFIRYGEKSDYGLYMLLFGAINLAQGFQNALFISPFATLYPQAIREERKSIIQFLVWGQICFGFAASCLGIAVCAIYFTFVEKLSLNVVLELAFGFALAILGLIAREASRSYQYVLARAGTALAGDIAYGVLLIVGLVGMVGHIGVTAPGVLALTGVAGLLPLILTHVLRTVPPIGFPRTVGLTFWGCGRWAIIGVVIAWMNLNFLGYAAAIAYGVTAVAEINAARLFMMPLALALPVWSNLLRPHFSQWYAEGDFLKMRHASNRSIAVGIVLAVAYTSVVTIAFPYLEKLVGPDYAKIFPIILAWSFFYGVVAIRTVLMANLMVNEAGYKSLSKVSSFGLLLLGPAMVFASQGTVVWTVYALVIIEIAQTLLVWKWAREYWVEVSDVK